MNSDLCCFWIYIGTECMSCSVIAPEDFVLPLLATPQLKERYIRHAFSDYVRSHPELKFCPSPHCNMIIRANENKAKRIVCHSCNAKFWYWIVFFKSAFSFVNNLELIYLVFDVVVNITLRLIAKRFDSGWPSVQMIAKRPTTLQLILKWADLATFQISSFQQCPNYFDYNQTCPKCQICIEKNGGCNHIQCYKCKHEFCWVCLGDWKTHSARCSRYEENPNVAYKSSQARANESLKKYLHYFGRVAAYFYHFLF